MLTMITLKEKTDSWKDVIPIWAKRIFMSGNKLAIERIDPNVTALYNLDACVVAEPYGMSREYCRTTLGSFCCICHMFSGSILGGDIGNDLLDINEVDQFVKHVRKDHPHLIGGDQ